MWLGSLLKGLGSSAGGCLCSVGGLGSVDSVPSAECTLDFLVGGVWIDFWAFSCWPSLTSWNSTEPVVKHNEQMLQYEGGKWGGAGAEALLPTYSCSCSLHQLCTFTPCQAGAEHRRPPIFHLYLLPYCRWRAIYTDRKKGVKEKIFFRPYSLEIMFLYWISNFVVLHKELFKALDFLLTLNVIHEFINTIKNGYC